jgi:hypothetical protein
MGKTFLGIIILSDASFLVTEKFGIKQSFQTKEAKVLSKSIYIKNISISKIIQFSRNLPLV